MESIAAEALSRLENGVASLLPPAPDPDLAPGLQADIRRILPTGLGGFVGVHADPVGEITGARLEADARITVRAGNVEDLGDAVSAVTRALLAADPAALRAQGILRLALEELGPATVGSAGTAASRVLSFRVLFEHLRLPEEAGNTIRRVPLDLELDRGAAPPAIVGIEFRKNPLESFEVVDDPAATTDSPSNWAHNAAEERIEQRSLIRGGGVAGNNPNNPLKPGTYLLLRANPQRPTLQDFVLRTTLQSDGTGGIGLVFRWRDENNFYFFLMDAQHTCRLLARKVDGTFASLDAAALDTTRGYEPGRSYNVKLTVDGPLFRVFLDGDRILEGRDAVLPGPGRVGFLSRNNGASFFYRISLQAT